MDYGSVRGPRAAGAAPPCAGKAAAPLRDDGASSSSSAGDTDAVVGRAAGSLSCWLVAPYIAIGVVLIVLSAYVPPTCTVRLHLVMLALGLLYCAMSAVMCVGLFCGAAVAWNESVRGLLEPPRGGSHRSLGTGSPARDHLESDKEAQYAAQDLAQNEGQALLKEDPGQPTSLVKLALLEMGALVVAVAFAAIAAFWLWGIIAASKVPASGESCGRAPMSFWLMLLGTLATQCCGIQVCMFCWPGLLAA